MFDLSAGANQRYIHVYNEAGLSGLLPGYCQGRPATLAWTKAEWLDLLSQSPAELTLLETGALPSGSCGEGGGQRHGFTHSTHSTSSNDNGSPSCNT